ncbi:hypothetical protein [Neobacillus mesonae]|uniref:hypothetical protein n=1 Tax=Neobacillus mesonae TaxID=1193713 RepID=UPI000FDBA926|nr:hypothetical protein [Neobacillus mesonae]
MTVNFRYTARNVSTYVLWILAVFYTVVKLANQMFPLFPGYHHVCCDWVGICCGLSIRQQQYAGH